MKYLLKVIKYFITFILLTLILVLVIVLTSNGQMSFTDALSPETGLWRGNNLYLILAFFALMAGVYPALNTLKKEVYITGTFNDNKEKISTAFENLGYALVEEDGEMLVYRKSKPFVRLMRSFDDKVIVTKGDSSIIIKGLRKDVMRLVSYISYTCNPRDEQ